MKKLLLVACLLAIPVRAGPRSAIKKLTYRLTFTTLTENPVRPFVVKRAYVAKFRVVVAKAPPCWPSATFDQQAQSILDEASDIDNAPSFSRIKRLLDYMRANLTDLQVVYLGNEPRWDIHVFGRDRRGNLVGFHYIEVV